MGSDISLSKAVRANLLSLQNTAEMMNKTQNRLATGNKVNSALDNPSNFFTASALNSRAADMSNLLDSMASGIKVIEAANNGITALTKNLESMQSTLRQARQDKSFQTQSFEVNDNTVLKLGGGQFSDSVSELSLATAAQPGKQAKITTTGTSAFLGPQSSTAGTTGAGARSVISLTPGAFSAGDVFKVAGIDVTVANTNADAAITAEDVAANIRTALDDSAVAGQFVVSLGTGDNDGKIIIESVNTSAAAASVDFDPDSDPSTGVGAATMGKTTFNYSAVTTSITVGDNTVETGVSFDTFVANLKAGEKDGGYKVDFDTTSKQITLTSTQWGGAPPEVTGVATYSAEVPATKAVTTFQIASAGVGTSAETTFQLQVDGSGDLLNDQELEVGDYDDPVVLTAGMDAAAIKLAFEDIIGDDYDVEVDADLNVTLTGKEVGGAALTVTSDQAEVTGNDASITGAGGVDLGALADLNAYSGVAISIDDGTGAVSHTISNGNTFADLKTALETGGKYTVTSGAGGLSIVSAGEANFTVTITGGSGAAFGMGGTTKASTNGVTTQAAGIVGGNAAVEAEAGTTAIANATVDSDQTLTIDDEEITITSAMQVADVRQAFADNAVLSGKYDIVVADDFTITMTAKTEGAATAASVASSQQGVEVVPATVVLDGVDFNDAALDMSTLDNQTITLRTDDGEEVDYEFDNTTDQLTAMATALEADGFEMAVDADTGALTFSRADGKNFTVELSGGPNSVLGMPAATMVSIDGVEAQPHGIVGGNADGVDATNGTAVQAEVKGVQETPAAQGASVASVEAEKNTFTVSYDGKTANVSVAGVKGGVGSSVNALDIKNWQDATVAEVNKQLKNQGVLGVEAQFDDAGKLTFIAKEAEAKTLAVSGDDAVALFGTNGVDTGVAEKSGLNATKTVDKFVELINREMSGKVRASNDNGKLRIENLSTQALDIGIDTAGAVSSLKVEGNTVRANLSKQFNELRDQLDKLSDDASFNGINLLRGDKLKITFNESGTSSIDIQAKDKDGNVRGINASNLNIDSLVAEDLDTDEAIDAFLAKLSSALTELRSQASSFGSNLSSVENRQSFTKNMINTLETGAANLTLADTNEEAANLLALQTRQQLSSSALSMASQQDQAVLQLLR
ncbi:flagellin [Devosia sp. FJ2-5-3]|uniref:flagellin N-terminal helical domain-containing protein n=1 Tax=Devosia sp. FJ2-5-3 TaxID=2976680 RepID=UPI0023D8049A|nr:flagellin [Devosia sp. FJ2-5-3]WEJ58081.1 flagellin [Devosia sp. FJ2-5-3]